MTTTPQWGDEALKTLPKATHLIVPFSTHSTMSDPCVRQVITQFFNNDGDIASTDTSCVSSIKEPAWQ
jgi:hypothetical protein